MPKPFAVRVLRLADETTQDMPYKSFLYIKDDIDDVTHQRKFELIGEIDSAGNLVPGSPNLDPQHRKAVPQVKSAEPVVNAEANTAAPAQDAAAPTSEAPKRRGRRPAQVVLQETQA